MPLDPVVRRMISSAGGLTAVARYGPEATAARARRGLDEGPKSWNAKARALAAETGEVLTDEELARRAELLRRAHIAKMTARSIAVRRAKAAGRTAGFPEGAEAEAVAS